MHGTIFWEAVGQDDVSGRVVAGWNGAIGARRIVGDVGGAGEKDQSSLSGAPIIERAGGI